ncbi:MAG TPA: sulfatase [Candidatus Hydrogenedentes bacterium]|nr:sulfatase [Candidatus Hydrogenedentota bacterium]
MKITHHFLTGALVLCMSLFSGASYAVSEYHTADQNHDFKISLSELMRIVQFFNSNGFHCQEGTEDGYGLGPGDTSCAPHASDYIPQDWAINFSELLRMVQFFNCGAYSNCASVDPPTEDGYCIGNRRNLVILLLDAFRADRIGATRNEIPIAPFLNSFAEGGARFTHAISPASWTWPSVAALFSGVYPESLVGAAESPDFKIPAGHQTLTEWLKNAGYDVWGFTTNIYIIPENGLLRGLPDGHFSLSEVLPAADVTDAVLSSIDEWQEPFFYYVHYREPHGPYAPPTEYQTFFGPQPETTADDEYDLDPANFDNYIFDLYESWVTHTAPDFPPLTEGGIEAMRYRYDANARYVDTEAGRLITQITARYPNTIFIILADHGEELMERGFCGHGVTLNEELIRVPLIVAGPGVTPRTVSYPVEILGMLPAISYLLGLPGNPDWVGRNFFFDNGYTPLFSYTWFTFFEVNNKANSVVLSNMKYVEHTLVGVPQLFNLSTDPGETTNLASSQPEQTAMMQALLETYRQNLK